MWLKQLILDIAIDLQLFNRRVVHSSDILILKQHFKGA